MEITNVELENTIEQYNVEIDILNGLKTVIEVSVCDGQVDGHIESPNYNIWNSLTLQQKSEIDSMLEDYFSK